MASDRVSKIRNDIRFLTECVFRSYSLIFFSNSLLFGLLLICVSMFELKSGLCGLVSCIVANCFGRLVNAHKSNLRSGYYGFNAVLCGIAIGIIFQSVCNLGVMVVTGALLSICLCLAMDGLLKSHYLPYLSLPFVLCLWLFLFLSQQKDDMIGFNQILTSCVSDLDSVSRWTDFFVAFVKDYFRSISFVFFRCDVLVGAVIAIGLFFHSRISFIYSVVVFFIGYLVSILFCTEVYRVPFILYGFNFIMIAVAAGSYYLLPGYKSLLIVIVSVLPATMLSIGLTRFLSYFYLPVYSLPFIVICLLIIVVMKNTEKGGAGIITYYIDKTPEFSRYNYDVNSQRLSLDNMVRFSLPFNGRWKVTQGIDGEYTHKGDQWRNAFDFMIVNEDGLSYTGDGSCLTDYYSWDAPVLASASGRVCEVRRDVSDNTPGTVNSKDSWGNYVVLDHNGVYTLYSHLRRGSIRCVVGESLSKGDEIGRCGNSGNSPYPHIHFQVQNGAFAGSASVLRPISLLSLHSDSDVKIVERYIPRQNDLISNINIDMYAEPVFHLGRYEFVRLVSDRRGESKLTVKTDSLGYTYLEDTKNNCRAWFQTVSGQFRFLRYEGSHNSDLFCFFLSFYNVDLSDSRTITKVEDIMSRSYAPFDVFSLLSDVVSVVSSPSPLFYQSVRTQAQNGDFLCFNSSIFDNIPLRRKLLYNFDVRICSESHCIVSMHNGEAVHNVDVFFDEYRV